MRRAGKPGVFVSPLITEGNYTRGRAQWEAFLAEPAENFDYLLPEYLCQEEL
ncbi:hypothetical protein SBV1_1420049 [Verrucomicrobia bacterium]|nr:hypothetical protein SBV1_1420049 [Verrucomicrobiota bacterium]